MIQSKKSLGIVTSEYEEVSCMLSSKYFVYNLLCMHKNDG